MISYSLEEYLKQRSLSLEPLAFDLNPILENEELLAELAAVWREHKGAITALIQLRCNAIGKKVLLDMTLPPGEHSILKQSIVEVGAIVSDFDKYLGEFERREKQPKEETPQSEL